MSRAHRRPVRHEGQGDPPGNGRTYGRLLPNWSLEFVYDAAHAIQQDRPEASAHVTAAFLRRGLLYIIPDKDTLINP